MTSLGSEIKDARMAQNIGLRAFGRVIGKSSSYLSDIERGYRMPSDETLKAICDALKLDYSTLRYLSGRVMWDGTLGGLLDMHEDAEPFAKWGITRATRVRVFVVPD